MDLDKGSLRWRKGSHLPPSTSRLMPGHPLNNNPPEAKAPLLLLLPVSIAEHEVIRYGLSPWPVLVSCPWGMSSQSLARPTPTHCSRGGAKENLDVMETLLSNRQNTSVIYTGLATDPEYSTLYRLLRRNLTPSQSDPVQGKKRTE